MNILKTGYEGTAYIIEVGRKILDRFSLHEREIWAYRNDVRNVIILIKFAT